MANRFTDYDPKERVSNYVPLPLEFMAKTLAMKQDKFDKTLEEAYKAEDLMKSVNAIDEHSQFKKQLDDKYSTSVEAIADDIIKTGNTSRLNDIKRISNQWQNDPLRIELETSFANRKLESNKKIELGSKYAAWGDPNTGFTGTDEKGNIQPLRFKGLLEKQDHQKKANEMMSGFKPSGLDREYFVFDDNNNVISIKDGYEGIAQGVIDKAAIYKAPDFISTIEGEDWTRMFLNKNPKATQEDLMIGAARYLANSGMNQVGVKDVDNKSFNYAPQYMYDQKNPKTLPREHSFQYETPMVDMEMAFDTDKLEKRDRSSKFPGTYTGSTYYSPNQNLSLEDVSNVKKRIDSFGTLTSKEQEVYDGIANNVFGVNPKKVTGATLDNLNKQIKGYIDGAKKVKMSTYSTSISSNEEYPGGKGSSGLTKMVFGDDKVSKNGITGAFINEDYWSPETGKMSGTEFQKKVLSELEDGTPISIVSEFNYKNPFVVLTGGDKRFASSYQVVVGGKQYVMSNTQEMIDGHNVSQDKQDLNDISNVEYTLEKSGIINKRGKTGHNVKAKIDISKDGKWHMEIPSAKFKTEGNSPENLQDNYLDWLEGKTNMGKSQEGWTKTSPTPLK